MSWSAQLAADHGLLDNAVRAWVGYRPTDHGRFVHDKINLVSLRNRRDKSLICVAKSPRKLKILPRNCREILKYPFRDAAKFLLIFREL